MNPRVMALSMVLVGVASSVSAQIIAWETSGLTSYGPSPFAATTIHSNLSSGGLIRGSGITTGGTPPADVWGGTGWDTSATTVAAAISAGEFVTFTLSASTGYQFSLTALSANFRRSASGPSSFQWQYSTNGSSFTDIGSPFSYTGTETNGLAQTSITLSGISALQNIGSSTTLTLRLVTYGANGSTGSWGFGRLAGNDLALTGSVTAIPEPATYAAMAGAVALLGVMAIRRRAARARNLA